MKIIILVEMATALTFVCEIPETGKLHNAEAAGGTRSGKESESCESPAMQLPLEAFVCKTV